MSSTMLYMSALFFPSQHYVLSPQTSNEVASHTRRQSQLENKVSVNIVFSFEGRLQRPCDAKDELSSVFLFAMLVC